MITILLKKGMMSLTLASASLDIGRDLVDEAFKWLKQLESNNVSLSPFNEEKRVIQEMLQLNKFLRGE